MKKFGTLEGNPQAMTLENGHLFIATWAMEGGATAGLSSINLETETLKHVREIIHSILTLE